MDFFFGRPPSALRKKITRVITEPTQANHLSPSVSLVLRPSSIEGEGREATTKQWHAPS